MENQFGAASTCSCDAEALYFKHFHVDISIIKMLCVRMLFCNWSFCFFNVKQRRFNALLFPNLYFKTFGLNLRNVSGFGDVSSAAGWGRRWSWQSSDVAVSTCSAKTPRGCIVFVPIPCTTKLEVAGVWMPIPRQQHWSDCVVWTRWGE